MKIVNNNVNDGVDEESEKNILIFNEAVVEELYKYKIYNWSKNDTFMTISPTKHMPDLGNDLTSDKIGINNW